jgi:multisubunit Na+/H+ antiporter MnhC subunit
MDVECSFWLEFVALFCLGLIGIISVLPYSAAIRKLTGHSSRRSYRLIIILQIIQGAVLLIVAIGVGLPSAHAVGLGAPMVESILRGQYFSGLISAMPLTAVISGLTTSIVILLLDRMLFIRHLPGRFGEITSKIPISYSFLASLYGGTSGACSLTLRSSASDGQCCSKVELHPTMRGRRSRTRIAISSTNSEAKARN